MCRTPRPSIHGQPRSCRERPVFLDETWVHTAMTPTRGRTAGRTLPGAAPDGHCKTTTFVAALRSDAVMAPLVLDGPIDGASFLAYVRQFLCATLRPGDVVIADNLSSHKVAGVREAIERHRDRLYCIRNSSRRARAPNAIRTRPIVGGQKLELCAWPASGRYRSRWRRSQPSSM